MRIYVVCAGRVGSAFVDREMAEDSAARLNGNEQARTLSPEPEGHYDDPGDSAPLEYRVVQLTVQ